MAFGLALGKLGLTGGKRWTPAQLWPLGAASPGMWSDPPYTASLFSTSAGTTAISAIGTVLDSNNPVGLVLDRKGDLALGAELVDTANTAAAWTPYGSNTVTQDGGAVKITYVGGSGATYGAYVLLDAAGGLVSNPVAGKGYRLTANVRVSAGASVTVAAKINGATYGSVPITSTTDTPIEYSFVYTTGTLQFEVDGTLGAGEQIWFSSISVREIPGIHLSQATSTSRPVASARSNFFTKTGDFSDAAWGKLNATAGVGSITPTAVSGVHRITQVSGNSLGVIHASLEFKANGYNKVGFTESLNSALASRILDLRDGSTTGSAGVAGSTTVTALADGWFRMDWSFTGFPAVANNTLGITVMPDSALGAWNIWSSTWTPDGTSGVLVRKPSSTLSPFVSYQAVVSASDYDASAGPTYLKFDGIDDSLASAAFAAGTLTSSMDCLIAVRKDASETTIMILGPYGTAGFIGAANYADTAACFAGVGSPTTWVDGVQLAGGTAVQRDTLNTALPPGNWHIIEYRGLDMSAWTDIKYGGFSGWLVNGALSPILLFASGQDANRDKARAEMASYFGVTLP